MPIVDAKNRLLINKLVKNYFGLSKESYKLFRHRLLYDRNFPVEFQRMLEKHGDSESRIRVPIKGENLESFDAGWKRFNNIFGSFQRNFKRDENNRYITGIEYKEFRSNKIAVGKQLTKLKKVLLNYYTKNALMAMRTWVVVEDLVYSLIKIKALGKIEKLQGGQNERIYIDSIRRGNREIWIVIFGSDNTEIEITQEEIAEEPLYKNVIEDLMLKDLEEIGTMKISSNSKLEIVFSLNYADWFLASTKENWTSCINLESDYSGAMWSGLPGLIGDKSRFLVYLTDGTKKNYMGIKVDKMINRSFGIYTRKKSSWEERLFMFKTYPLADINLSKMANDLVLPLIQDFAPKIVSFTDSPHDGMLSRHYSELLYNYSNIDSKFSICKIFFDNGMGYCFAKNNKAKYFPYQYAYMKPYGDIYGPTSVYFLNNPHTEGNRIDPYNTYSRDYHGFACDIGLSGVMENDLSLQDYHAMVTDDVYVHLEDLGVA